MRDGVTEAVAARDTSRHALREANSAIPRESAVSPSTYSVPGRFLWLADAAMLTFAFFLARSLAPTMQPFFTAERAGRIPWLQWLSFQSAASPVLYRPLQDVVWILLVTVPATLLAMLAVGGYRPLLEQSRTRMVLTCTAAPLVGFGLVALTMVFARHFDTSRAFLSSFALLTTAGFLTSRTVTRGYKTRRLRAGNYARNVVVVAPPEARRRLTDHFADHVSPNVRRLYGYLEVPGPTRSSPVGAEKPDGLRRLGEVGDLGELLVNTPIHEVLAVEDSDSGRWLRSVIEQCEYFQLTLRLVPEELISFAARPSHLGFRAGPLGLPEVELRPRHLDGDALFVKRALDIVVSATALVLLAPLFALIAIAIRVTTPKLPVLYPWHVIGYKGRAFTGYKFTSMVADADERKAVLMPLNEMTGPVFKIKNDPRMTPVGRWLRKFSLNELPQLWSVLKGDMSLVGPRPAYPNELARYELWQKRKLCVQPGITCLWQVRGRNKISSFDDWVRMDFEYIDHWSLWLDLKIIVRTVWAVVWGSGS